jgi:hypothetical protein
MSTRGIYLFQHSGDLFFDLNNTVYDSFVHAAYIHHDNYPSGATGYLENWICHSVEHQEIKTEWPLTFESFIRCNKQAQVVRSHNWRCEDYNYLYIIKLDSHNRLSLQSPMDVYKKEFPETMPSYGRYQNGLFHPANLTMKLEDFITYNYLRKKPEVGTSNDRLNAKMKYINEFSEQYPERPYE